MGAGRTQTIFIKQFKFDPFLDMENMSAVTYGGPIKKYA
jgi:hypothetical protein